MKERIKWIDSARGLAFLMVIYFHLSTTWVSNSCLYFTPVFLSMFFFVSGYLFKGGQPFGKVLEQRTRTIFLPFLIFGLGGGILLGISKLGSDSFVDALIDTFKSVFYQQGDHRTLWFLASLYVFSLIYYWVDRWCKCSKHLLIVCLCLFAINQVVTFVFGVDDLPWELDKTGFCCFFMGMGQLYSRYEVRLEKYLTWKTALPCFVAYVTTIAIMQEYVIFGSCKHLLDSLVLYLTGFVWMLWLSKHVKCNSKFLLFIGTNSLLFFCMHRQVLNVVQSVWTKALPRVGLEASVLTNIVEVIIIALLLVIPTLIINKFIPQLSGKGFKLWR